MEQIIKNFVKKFGKEKVIKGFEVIGLLQPKSEVSTFGTCSTGYYWSETLERCVLNVGGGDTDPDPEP